MNFLVNSLIKSGYIKARRFKNSKGKIAYVYVLTPKGVTRRVEGAKAFLERKTRGGRCLALIFTICGTCM